jgi:hypothetical protein
MLGEIEIVSLSSLTETLCMSVPVLIFFFYLELFSWVFRFETWFRICFNTCSGSNFVWRKVFLVVPVWFFIIEFIYHRVLIWNLIWELFSNLFWFKRCSQDSFFGVFRLRFIEGWCWLCWTLMRTSLTFIIIWNTCWNCFGIDFVFNSWIILFFISMARCRGQDGKNVRKWCEVPYLYHEVVHDVEQPTHQAVE